MFLQSGRLTGLAAIHESTHRSQDLKMRAPSRLAAVLVFLLAAACRSSGGAYGPGSDERLEAETTQKASAEGSDDATKTNCAELGKKLKENKSEEKPEADRLQGMNELFVDAKGRYTKLDDAVGKNPDLVYAEHAAAVKANLDECRHVFADVRSELDRFLREVCDLPVIQEVQGNAKVNVARLDYGLIRTAIGTLDPDDKDMLLAKVDAAEKKTGAAKGGAPPGKKK